jgi:3-oxoacyl-[acyl-carrier-protein] synthase III
MPIRIKILATGKYLPKNRVTVADLEERLGLETGWIAQKSGVMARHFIEEEAASQMGAFAARQALQTVGLSINDIDCLVCTSSVPE